MARLILEIPESVLEMAASEHLLIETMKNIHLKFNGINWIFYMIGVTFTLYYLVYTIYLASCFLQRDILALYVFNIRFRLENYIENEEDTDEMVEYEYKEENRHFASSSSSFSLNSSTDNDLELDDNFESYENLFLPIVLDSISEDYDISINDINIDNVGDNSEREANKENEEGGIDSIIKQSWRNLNDDISNGSEIDIYENFNGNNAFDISRITICRYDSNSLPPILPPINLEEQSFIDLDEVLGFNEEENENDEYDQCFICILDSAPIRNTHINTSFNVSWAEPLPKYTESPQDY